MKKTKKISLCAMLTALGVVALYLGSVFEVMDLSVSCIASLTVLFCSVELGGRYSFAVYAATSILSFILVPNKWIAVYFIMFFGIMPITKKLFEKTGKVFSWVLKIAAFNVEIFAFYFIAKNLDFFAEGESGLPYLLAMLVIANAAFIMADMLYTLLFRLYCKKYRARIRKFLK
jgi:hypothetical protein